MAIKSREYEDRIRNMGFERATKTVVMEVIEQHNQLEKTLVMYAQQHDQMMTIMQNIVDMGSNLKKSQDFINSQLGNKIDPDAPLPNDDRS